MATVQENLYPHGDIGKRLSQIRYFFRESQEQFAKRLGTTRASIIRYEKGDRKINTEILYVLDSMDINVGWLFSGKGDMLVYRTTNNRIEESVAKYINIDSLQNIRALELVIETLREFVTNINQELFLLNDKIREKYKAEGIPWKKNMI